LWSIVSINHQLRIQKPIKGKTKPSMGLGGQLFWILALFRFFCTTMLFAVSFQKMDSNLGAIIIGAEVTHSDASTIGANFSYVAADVASLRGSAS
jgi:hypothetical protein